VGRQQDAEAASLTIAVLTYRRPADLAAILPLLAAQAAAVEPPLRARVLVVDNDPDAGARSAVEAFAATAAVPVVYEHEPVPGISAARNRALDASAAEDLLVFIDDDERPSEHWLRNLLATRRSTGATAVVGPVVSTFEVEPDDFIRAGRFFDRLRHPTGTALEVAATNNLLLDLREVRRLGVRFDPAFGITGGDDTMFTRQLRQRGGSMVWCDEAVVVDVVPAARITRRWVILRALSSGNSWGLTSMRLAPSTPARVAAGARLHARGGARLLGGLGQAALGTVGRNKAHRARGIRTSARGLGMILGAWGVSYREYRRD
jgi:glycosyltransferase involved in cell wall biosynthesis